MYKKISVFIFFMLPILVLALPGPYFKAEVGKVAISTPFPLFLLDNNDASGVGGRIAGGYLFGESHFNYGVEAGTLIYPHLSGHNCAFLASCTNEITKGYGVDVLGVLKYTFDSQFIMLAKGGAIYNNQKINSKGVETLNGVKTWTEKNSTSISYSPELALGIGYQLPYNTEIDLTESMIFTHQGLMSSLLLGLAYSF